MSAESDRLVIEDLADELARERALVDGLVVDLESANLVLSEALTALVRLTVQNKALTDTIRRAHGLPVDDSRRQPVQPAVVADVDLPDQMMLRARDIPWQSPRV
jgi:hypothetical protein